MEKMNTKGYKIEDDYSGDSDNFHRNQIRHPNGEIIREGIYDCDLKKVLDRLPDVSNWGKQKIETPATEVIKTEPNRKLVLIMEPTKKDNTENFCNKSCPFYSTTPNGDMGPLCKTLWGTAPKGKNPLASLCNYYDVKHITVAEVDENVTIAEILNRDIIIPVRE